jgi:hypothetical protein
MCHLNGFCDAKFYTPIVSEIARIEFVSTVQCALGLRLLYTFVKTAGCLNQNGCLLRASLLFRCVINLMGLRFVMLLFAKALVYFLRFFRQRFNNEQVDLIF